jgi:iron(III) transport system substrate-binding protein
MVQSNSNPSLEDRNTNITRRTALKYLGGLGLGAAAAYLAACAPAAPAAPTTAPAAAAAKATGTVSIYSALNQSTNDAFFAAFKASNPGLDVAVLPIAAAGQLQTRIITEKASPKADVFVGGDRAFHDGLGKQGLLEQYVSPNAAAVPDAFKDPNGFWTGWYVGIFAFVHNTDRFGKEMTNSKPPASWDDLLDPAWKGKLIMPSPITTGGGFIFLATQVFRFNRDEAKAMDFMKKLHANIAQYIDSGPNGIQLVAQGQFIGCPNWAHDILTSKNQGNPVALDIVPDTGNEVGSVSIVKGGPNTAGAKAFVDWMLTKDAGALNVKLSNRDSVLPDVPPAAGAPTLSTVKMVNYDASWASSNQQRLVKLWQSTVGL